MNATKHEIDRCFTVSELAIRWRCRAEKVRLMIKRGTLAAMDLGSQGLRITPEVVREAEQKTLAVTPKVKRRRERVDPRVLAMLDDMP